MSHGWKLSVLKRRRAYLANRLQEAAASGGPTKLDKREFDALDWAIETLDPLVPRA